MKILVTYYSRGGSTRKAAVRIAGILKSDIEQIRDTKNREGITGFLAAIPPSVLKKSTILEKVEKNPLEYDIVVLGTPVWTSTVSIPVRTYLQQNRGKFRKLCFFCTECGSGHKQAFREMEQIAGKKPDAVLKIAGITDLRTDVYTAKIAEFCGKVLNLSL